MQRCVTGSTGSGGSAFPKGHGSAEPQAEGEDRSLEDWASQRPRALSGNYSSVPQGAAGRAGRGSAVGVEALGTREHPRPSTHGRQLQTRARSSERGTQEGQAEDRLLRHGVL